MANDDKRGKWEATLRNVRATKKRVDRVEAKIDDLVLLLLRLIQRVEEGRTAPRLSDLTRDLRAPSSAKPRSRPTKRRSSS